MVDGLRGAHAKTQRLRRRRERAFLQHGALLRRHFIQVFIAAETLGGLVHAIPPDNAFVVQVSGLSYAVRKNAKGGNEVRLEVVLDVLPVNYAFWRIFSPGEE